MLNISTFFVTCVTVRDRGPVAKRVRTPLYLVACLIVLAQCLMAHDPHDPILTVAVSPNYSNDQTIFASTSELSFKIDAVALFKSTDGGINWAPVAGLPQDTTIVAMVFSPAYSQDQTIYLAGANGGLFMSTNAGNSWTVASTQGAIDVALSPSFATDNTLFMLVPGKKILRSTNRGQSWINVPAPKNLTNGMTIITLSPNYLTDRTLLLGTTADGIFQSSNNGATWQSVTSTMVVPEVSGLLFSPNFSTDHKAFASTLGSGILVSHNRGITWTASNDGITDLNLTSLALSPQYAQDSTIWTTAGVGGVFQSTTAGTSWSVVGLVSRVLSDLATVHYKSIAPTVGPSGPVLFLGMFEGMWVSTDAGATWRYIDLLPTRLIRYINISPAFAQDHTIFASTYGSGNLWSKTAGSSWSFQNTGMQFSYTDASAISPNYLSDGTAFSSNLNGLQRTSNRGLSWQTMTGLGVAAYPRAVVVSPAFAQDSTVFIGLSVAVGQGTVMKTLPHKQTNSGIYRSINRGQTWLPTSLSGKTSICSAAVSPAFAADRTAFAASQDTGVYRSTDGGLNWTALSLNVTTAALVAVSPSFASDNTVFVAGSPGGLYRSTNRGATWTELPGTANLRILALQVSPNYAVDQSFLAGTIQSGLVRFTQGGFSMSPVTSFPDVFVTAIGISPNYANDHTIFAAAYHGLYKSTNSGTTWTNTSAPARIEESQTPAGPLNEPPTLIYQGTWSNVTPSGTASTNAFMTTGAPQAAVVFSFSGSGVAWITATGPSQGSATIELDGVSQGSVSLTSPIDMYQQNVWQNLSLACGLHTMTITAKPNAGQTVSIDAFNIWVNNCP